MEATNLVYCNISTLLEKKMKNRHGRRLIADCRTFIATILASFTSRPEWRLVLSCGPFAKEYGQASLAKNIRVFEQVPQLEVLKKASLVITQGGAGTVRECVSQGRPMVVFPMWADQFGNAARVASQGLGLVGDYRTVSSEELVALVETILTQDAIVGAMKNFSEHCKADAEHEEDALITFLRRKTSLEI
jgi:UDP:flavonoid glycosyltransferase YjiC (YdhE family)